MRDAREDFAAFALRFFNGEVVAGIGQVFAQTALSAAVLKALKQRGFKFVGPVIVHAWMQAAGLVNDHAAGVSGAGRFRRVSFCCAQDGLLRCACNDGEGLTLECHGAN